MFWGLGIREGLLEREEAMEGGRVARKAPRQFIVRGIWKVGRPVSGR